MTQLETAITAVREQAAQTSASIDIAGNDPRIMDGDGLDARTQSNLISSGRQGMRAQSTLSELFNIHARNYEQRAQNNLPGARTELDRFEAQYSMFVEATDRFREACANKKK